LYHVCIKKCDSFNNNPSEECVTANQGRGYTCTLGKIGEGSKCVEKCDLRSVPESHAQGETPGLSTCESEPPEDYNCRLNFEEKSVNGIMTVMYSCLEVVDNQLECYRIIGYVECVEAGIDPIKRPTG
jgi:hypothetical protein